MAMKNRDVVYEIIGVGYSWHGYGANANKDVILLEIGIPPGQLFFENKNTGESVLVGETDGDYVSLALTKDNFQKVTGLCFPDSPGLSATRKKLEDVLKGKLMKLHIGGMSERAKARSYSASILY